MSPRSPSLWSRFRQTIGRALRETGQALDRVGIRGTEHALRPRRIGDNPYLFNDHLSRHRHLFPLLSCGAPRISPQVSFLAPCSTLIGSVHVGPHSSVWYGAVLRGDACENAINEQEPWDLKEDDHDDYQLGGGIFIGSHTNVQDGSVITARQGHTVIGNGVTIGHLAQIHSSIVEDHCLIGMGSMLLEGSVVESESLIAAGAVVSRNERIPSGELWVGNPARKLRDLTKEERARLHQQANEYVKVAETQKGVMELGGNMPESVLEHLMLGSSSRQEEEEALDSAEKQAPRAIPFEQEPSLAEKEQVEPLKVGNRVSENVV